MENIANQLQNIATCTCGRPLDRPHCPQCGSRNVYKLKKLGHVMRNPQGGDQTLVPAFTCRNCPQEFFFLNAPCAAPQARVSQRRIAEDRKVLKEMDPVTRTRAKKGARLLADLIERGGREALQAKAREANKPKKVPWEMTDEEIAEMTGSATPSTPSGNVATPEVAKPEDSIDRFADGKDPLFDAIASEVPPTGETNDE